MMHKISFFFSDWEGWNTVTIFWDFKISLLVTPNENKPGRILSASQRFHWWELRDAGEDAVMLLWI
jgi:hypothetical protein